MNSTDRSERLENYREHLQRAVSVLSEFSSGTKSNVDNDDPDADIIHAVSRDAGQALQELDEAISKLEQRLIELDDSVD